MQARVNEGGLEVLIRGSMRAKQCAFNVNTNCGDLCALFEYSENNIISLHCAATPLQYQLIEEEDKDDRDDYE